LSWFPKIVLVLVVVLDFFARKQNAIGGDVDDVFFSACSPLLTSHDQEIENEHEDENDWRRGTAERL
jgi:hypothetical protein